MDKLTFSNDVCFLLGEQRPLLLRTRSVRLSVRLHLPVSNRLTLKKLGWHSCQIIKDRQSDLRCITMHGGYQNSAEYRANYDVTVADCWVSA